MERAIITTPYGEPLKVDNQLISEVIHVGDADGKHYYSVPKKLQKMGNPVFSAKIDELGELMVISASFAKMNAVIREKYTEQQERTLQRKQDADYLKFIAEQQNEAESALIALGFTV